MRRVYFIRPIGFEGPIKIGYSCDPSNRAESLALWSPFPLEVIATIDGDHRLERRFHARFIASHNGHEWFAITPELLAVIAEVQAGTFDIETLPPPKYLFKTGARRGVKWPEDRKLQTRQNSAIKRAEKRSGLHLPWGDRQAKWEAFTANPCRETGGITEEERVARYAAYMTAHHLELAEKYSAPSPAHVS